MAATLCVATPPTTGRAASHLGRYSNHATEGPAQAGLSCRLELRQLTRRAPGSTRGDAFAAVGDTKGMNMTTTDELQLVNAVKATAMLAISLDTLDRMIEAGVITLVRLLPNGHRRFPLTDIAALIAEEEA